MIDRKEIVFEENQPYHILSRAVEGRKIFTEESSLRFIFQMYAANVGKPHFNLHRKDVRKAAEALLAGEEIPSEMIIVEHPPFVDFLSFVLVVNHYHFILVQNMEGGIPKLMQKLNGGFAKYFNLKNNRKGNLFEKPYKIIPIQTNFQLDAILCYVNVKNPLDVYQPGWREEGLKDWERAFQFLENYQLSSFSDLFGERKSKILAPKEKLEKYLGKEIKSREELRNFIKSFLQKETISYKSFFLEEP